jgi:hypothetical protein
VSGTLLQAAGSWGSTEPAWAVATAIGNRGQAGGARRPHRARQAGRWVKQARSVPRRSEEGFEVTVMNRQATRSRAAQPGTAPRRYYVYVVELDDAVGPRRNPGYPSLYVGQSVVPPNERLRQHKDGYRSSRYVRKHGKHLRPGLYRRFNPMATRDEAVAMEQELARRLRNRGYTVYGGH